METLELLGVAVGLASLAGLNLYLTVFLTGLAVRFGWITLAHEYAGLEVLGSPVVLVVAGILFAMEFTADKVPWVDSAWDAVHTAIRPVGAALLAITVLGESDPAFNVVAGLMAAWLGFSTHALKATVRLQANASPEPISNAVLSVAEDATVVLGLGLIFTYPLAALAVAVVFLAAIWFFVPRMLRATWVKLWLCTRKLRLAPEEPVVDDLPTDLPSTAKSALASPAHGGTKLLWAVPCISGPGPGYPRNRFGWLACVAGEREPHLFFVRRGRPGRPSALPAGHPSQARLERRFLADVLVLSWTDESAAFLFDRGSRPLAALLLGRLSRGES